MTSSFACMLHAALQEAGSTVGEIEQYLKNAAKGFSDVAVPACFTLLVANADATVVASEKYFYTS